MPPSRPQQAQDPSKPQQTPASPAGLFVTEQEARDRCTALGWSWPTEIKLKTLRKVQGVFPCTREAFEAALSSTTTAAPVDHVPFLAGTIANLEAKEKPPPPKTNKLPSASEYVDGHHDLRSFLR